ncbi:MAG: hypothetical protein A2284_02995 [Deltaproteobacteria bacterium RIFOXYA12_FULL_61_11]|nr:MAG: hypothetical protein A2284_02995 [Deltaproteobacteria bacterium RIFOXYA12_FULL_61_11]
MPGSLLPLKSVAAAWSRDIKDLMFLSKGCQRSPLRRSKFTNEKVDPTTGVLWPLLLFITPIEASCPLTGRLDANEELFQGRIGLLVGAAKCTP